MSTEIQTNIAATDSSLISTAIVPQTADSVQKTQNLVTAKAYTMVPPRRSFDEQRPFVFSIIGFAVFYIAVLVIGRIIKTRIIHRS
ncbi:hypothetical protein [Bacteroides sp.]|uniref:hypothetical protein n=1 Tax=Bacteroides sp. TaxID=29523 RepID=UPI0026257C2C|nr:hypothetical protein [Bacteroides sp.]MDD3039794.1 hypothetical protein [Bacteroides sp.]